ncbi:MAG: DNA primase [Firmicutes bacterium]|uniref:DNA primase n=1 Tax=Candidatus Scybalomonas excrementavium TaxID=2840943 RepID=A0A9D9N879_9FIRM|nr:DNA primase [Candidatus Scybalomonas excrementavium]
MYYSEDIVEEVRSRNDIVDVISGYIGLKKKGASYFGLCPFHNEKSPSFSVSREKQMYYCFGCGAGGNVFTFVMEYENFTFPETLKILADRAGMELPEVELSESEKKEADYKAVLREMNRQAANYFYLLLHSERGKSAYEYLTNRGITKEMIKKFGLGYADIYSNDLYQYLKSKGYTDAQLKDSGLVNIDEKRGGSDKFWNRVMFPILDTNSKVIGFGGRVMGDGNPKYLNSKETAVFDKSRNLFGLNLARTSRKSYFIVCEGYMDVITMHQAGFTNTVASLGTAFTPQHGNLLKRYVKEVILAYDSDEAGTKAALRAIPILKESGLSVRILNLKPYKDPDEFIKELGSEQLEERIGQAVSSFMFEISVLEGQYNQNDPESWTLFTHELAKKLATISERLERQNYLDACARTYQLNKRDLEELVNRYGMTASQYQKEARDKERERRVEKDNKDDGYRQSQRLLLTWMVNEPRLFERLEGIIGVDDFIEPSYHSVAAMLFEQYEKEKKVMPAKILNQFTEVEEHNQVASIFNTMLKMAPSEEDNEKALTDVVKRVKEYRINYEMEHSNDIILWQKLIRDKAELQKLHISLHFS